jgi:replication-associated recombination protein RarA
MSDSLDLGEPPQPVKPEAYRVLARKYRPQTFAELIGQDAMVTTLGNAIKRERLAHAFLMTGVRGVGKTSTARTASGRTDRAGRRFRRAAYASRACRSPRGVTST